MVLAVLYRAVRQKEIKGIQTGKEQVKQSQPTFQRPPPQDSSRKLLELKTFSAKNQDEKSTYNDQ